MARPVIVTEFFDLTKLEDQNSSTRSIDYYIRNGKGMLCLPYPMVIFCDTVTKPLIQSVREEATSAPTVYVEKNLAEYDHYKNNCKIVKENRTTGGWYGSHTRNTVSYFLTTSFKFVALNIADQRNDFDATHYFWIDFGLHHTVGEELFEYSKAIFENPNPKISSMYINYRSSKDLQKMEWVCNNGQCGMAGGFFSVERPYANKLYSLAMSVFYEQINRGVGHADEQIFTFCFDRRPEYFTIYYGDYKSLMCNYHEIRRDIWLIKECFIKKTMNACKRELAERVVKMALESKTLQLSQEDREMFQQILESTEQRTYDLLPGAE